MGEHEARIKAFTVLMRASQSVQKLIKQDFLKTEINLNEYAVMELLYHKGGQPIQTIGRRVLLGGGSITYVIDKLEGKGFLYRQPCQEDRRKMFACLTEAGTAYMDKRVVEQEALIKRLLTEWDDDEVEEVTDLLKRIGLRAEDLLDS